MAHLKIGEFQLDVERSRIISHSEIVALEPKVLEVLLVLLEQPGRVVPTTEIIEKVWGQVVVEQNALHRCIRQLRKAFNDSVKAQSYIETHPRKGYCLIASVIEDTTFSLTSTSNSKDISRPISLPIKTISYFVLAMVFLVTLAIYVNLPTKHLYQFNKLTPLTATDAIEANSVFSPDGQFVTFLREDDKGADHIWWLNLSTREERRLTEKSGFYRGLSWSPNGEKLTFSRIVGDDTKRCLQIESLYLPLAVSSPQQTRVLVKCDSYHYESPQWLDNNRFFAVQHTEEQSEVVLINTESGDREVVFTDNKDQIHTIAMSHATNKLAITILADQQKPKIFIYNVSDKTVELLPIEIPAAYSNHFHWHPVWDHLGSGFVFSVGRYLLYMSLVGDFTELHVSDSPDLRLADMSPAGTSIVMTVGKADRDILVHSLLDNDNKPAKSVGRSTVKEFSAKFNPKFEQIAFLSERSGSTNVWLEQDSKVKQVSNIPEGVEQFVWSPTGKEILLSHSDKLTVVSFGSREIRTRAVKTDYKVTRLFQWLEQSYALCSIEREGQHQLVKLNIETGEINSQYHGYSYWAQQSGDNLLVVSQSGNLLSIKKSGIEQLELAKKREPRTPFFVHDTSLYFVSKTKELLMYDLESKRIELLMKMPSSDTWLNDVDHINKRILMAEIQIRQTELVSFHN